MINIRNIEKYRENNRIEAKKALGGLPQSIWETYSAFANTLGGVILLGVEEHRDHTLHTVDLPDPERLVREFWEIVSDKARISANILSESDVCIENVGGDRIIVINVPRAGRFDRPIYMGGNPFASYRRNGEGDYKCTREEVEAMLRDADAKTSDMETPEGFCIRDLDPESVSELRERVRELRPGVAREELSDGGFLCAVGAAKELDGGIRPTSAGILMLGRPDAIRREFPHFELRYCGEVFWGNVLGFYILVSEKLRESGFPQNVLEAAGEALANCLVNADYRLAGGTEVNFDASGIELSNPGAFRISAEAAKEGGVSDPRNLAVMQMFCLIGKGNRTGSGIPNIFRVWRAQGWPEPEFRESFDPERTTLWLGFEGSVKKSHAGNSAIRAEAFREAVIDRLTVSVSATKSEIAELLGLSERRAGNILNSMTADGLITSEGGMYKLKA